MKTKHINALTWEDSDMISVDETAVSEKHLATDKSYTPYYRASIISKVSSQFVFARKPVRRTAANEVF